MLREKVLPCEPLDASSPSLVHECSLELLVVLQSAQVLCLEEVLVLCFEI